MKRIITFALTVLLAIACMKLFAQDTNLPPISGPITKVINFLGTGSNWMVTTYGIYSEKGADGKGSGYGGGLGAFVRINDFLATGMRLDALAIDGKTDVWMPSGDVQIQVPMTLFGKQTNGVPVQGTGLTLIPFTFGGVATTISGKGADNGTVVGIFGIGMAVRVAKKWDIVYDFEKWTGFSGNQHRFGVLYKF